MANENIQVNGDNFDEATLRLCYARSLLTTLAIFIGDSATIPHNPVLIADSLRGIEKTLEGIYDLLAAPSDAECQHERGDVASA